MNMRELERTIPSVATTDGGGVRIRRSIGAGADMRHDPFLMLDEFFSDNPDDYLAGFPSHPHRGFETVTYMLDGHMQHQDHMGNTGDLGPGDVQWMTAARGIIHSEMPQQTEGRMRGFQLWLNLPASEKMKPASYRDIASSEIPRVGHSDYTVKVIAGRYVSETREVVGPVVDATTEPHYFDVKIEPNAVFEVPVPRGHNAFLYLYEGEGVVGEKTSPLPLRSAALLTDGDVVRIHAGNEGASILLLSALPLGEPVVQYGPFVMNTPAEIEQALEDYRTGKLATA